MTRCRLPDRRLCSTIKVRWQFETGEQSFYLTFGRDPQTLRVLEVFYADGQRTGSQVQHLVQDACVILSLLLQYGADPFSINKSLGQIELLGEASPASILGAIVKAIEEEISYVKT